MFAFGFFPGFNQNHGFLLPVLKQGQFSSHCDDKQIILPFVS